MSRKYNQYRNKASRAAGSDGMDIQDKNNVKSILTTFGASKVIFDPYIVIDNLTDRFCIYTSINNNVAIELTHHTIRHPDILSYWKRCDGTSLPHLTEVDGSYHKDWDNDKDYDRIKIAYTKLNVDYLKKEEITWSSWLRDDLKTRWRLI